MIPQATSAVNKWWHRRIYIQSKRHKHDPTRLRAAVVKLSSLTNAEPTRTQHERLLDLRSGKNLPRLWEFHRAPVTILGRVEENIEEELRVGRPTLRHDEVGQRVQTSQCEEIANVNGIEAQEK